MGSCFKSVQSNQILQMIIKVKKMREKKEDSHYQAEMMMALFAAAWTELRGTKSEVEVTGDRLESCLLIGITQAMERGYYFLKEE